MSATMRFAIDGGGTSTRLAIEGPLRSTNRPCVFRSLNPASVDADESIALLRTALGTVSEYAVDNGGIPVSGVMAGAAISAETIGYWADLTAGILCDTGTVGEIVLTNDIDGLVVAPPVNGAGGVLVAGTGSGVMVMSPAGAVVRVGGWEYLASDEGSAFWLGRAGLTAAVRATDGRGHPTTVTGRIEEELGSPVREVARRLAELARPRQEVARLAACVTGAWTVDRDTVAERLVAAAVDELMLLVSTGMRRAGGVLPAWALTGGLVVQCEPFARLLVDRIARLDPVTSVQVVREPVAMLLRSRPLATYPPDLVRRTVKVPS